MEAITAARKRVYETYLQALQPLVDRGLVALPTVPEHCGTNYHMFYIVVESLAVRTALIEHLRAAGILAVFHYVPLHTSPVGLSMGYRSGMLPITESISDRVLRLPMYAALSSDEVDSVASEILSFYSLPRQSQAPR
jgi:dTDP-4-amino-4,6-dideoxygalactose transaminase